MRKFMVISALAVSAMGAGAMLAQEATQEAPTEQAAATAWLGVALVEQDGQVIVARVMPGSPADTADLEIGDVVTAFNGTDITVGTDLTEQVQAAAAGDVVTLDVLRNDVPTSLEVTLGSVPDFGRGLGGNRGLGRGRHGEFALPTDALSLSELLLRADLEEAGGGYSVVSVLGRNPLDLQEGDLITAVNDQPVTDLNLETLRESLAAMDTPALTITVERDGETVTLEADVLMGGPRGFGDRGRGNGRGFGNPPQGQQPDEEPATPESTADI